MRQIIQILAILTAVVLYNGATTETIINIIAKGNFYITYMAILYIIFLANILLFYGFYKFIEPFKYNIIYFKIILWGSFVIAPFIIALLYGTLFNKA